MHRRNFLVAASLGVTAVSGCVSSAGGGEESTTGTTSTQTTSTPEETTEVPDLRAPSITSTGTGTGVTDRFTAMGGPVFVSLTFDYTGMRNSNFIMHPIDENGDRLPPQTHWVNEKFDETRLEDDPEIYRLSVVTHFEPGDYFFDVRHAGGVFGDGPWDVVVYQPGVPADGESPPFTVDGYDGDVVGPVRTDGPVRVTVETSAPRLSGSGDPTTYNYRTEPTDRFGVKGARVLNSVETAPLTQSAVFFPAEDVEVGYFNVHSWGPWTATLEPA